MKNYETPEVQVAAVSTQIPVAYDDNLLPLSSLIQPK